VWGERPALDHAWKTHASCNRSKRCRHSIVVGWWCVGLVVAGWLGLACASSLRLASILLPLSEHDIHPPSSTHARRLQRSSSERGAWRHEMLVRGASRAVRGASRGVLPLLRHLTANATPTLPCVSPEGQREMGAGREGGREGGRGGERER